MEPLNRKTLREGPRRIGPKQASHLSQQPLVLVKKAATSGSQQSFIRGSAAKERCQAPGDGISIERDTAISGHIGIHIGAFHPVEEFGADHRIEDKRLLNLHPRRLSVPVGHDIGGRDQTICNCQGFLGIDTASPASLEKITGRQRGAFSSFRIGHAGIERSLKDGWFTRIERTDQSDVGHHPIAVTRFSIGTGPFVEVVEEHRTEPDRRFG